MDLCKKIERKVIEGKWKSISKAFEDSHFKKMDNFHFELQSCSSKINLTFINDARILVFNDHGSRVVWIHLC